MSYKSKAPKIPTKQKKMNTGVKIKATPVKDIPIEAWEIYISVNNGLTVIYEELEELRELNFAIPNQLKNKIKMLNNELEPLINEFLGFMHTKAKETVDLEQTLFRDHCKKVAKLRLEDRLAVLQTFDTTPNKRIVTLNNDLINANAEIRHLKDTIITLQQNNYGA